MSGTPDMMVVVVALVSLVGGGALGAALGGGLNFLTGGRARGAILMCAVLGGIFGVVSTFGLPMGTLASFMARFAGAPSDQETQNVLKTYYPDDFAQEQATERTLTTTGASRAQISAALHSQMVGLMQRQIPLANDENALAYLAIARDEQAFMAASRPDLCYRVTMAPSADSQQELAGAMPDDLKQREARLQLKLLEQTATAPQPPKPSADIDGKLKMWASTAVSGLSPEEKTALQSGGELRDKAACDAVGQVLYLISWSGSDAVEAFKALSAKGLEKTTG